jgi:hypothetical protein
MSDNALDEIYERVLDAQCGVYAIQEIVRNFSPADDNQRQDRRQNAIEWVADRISEQLQAVSSYAEAQAREIRERGR